MRVPLLDVELARFEPVWFGSAWFGSVWFESVRYESVWFEVAQLDPPLIDPPEIDPGQYLEPLLAGLVAFLLVFLLAWFVVVPALMTVIRKRNQRNLTIVEAVERYARLAAVVVAAMAAVAAAGYGDVLAGSALVLAALTLALGVAGREVIGDLVSGIFLVADPDFNVDDYIEWTGGEGVVETIRFRVTRVRTANNEVITVPNTTLATSTVTRPYSRDHFRLVVRFEVPFEADLDAVSSILREEIDRIERAMAAPPPTVAVEAFGDAGLALRVQFWVDLAPDGADRTGRDRAPGVHPSQVDVARARSTYISRVTDRLLAAGVDVSPAPGRELSGRIDIDPE